MGQISKVFYTIGRVFNIIEIVFDVLLLAASVVARAVPAEMAKGSQYTEEEWKRIGVIMIVAAAISIVISVVVLIIAGKARKAVNDGVVNYTPHIIILVVGIISFDVFYIVASILGIVNESQEVKQ